MTKNKIVGAIAALGLLGAPAVALAHGQGDDHGNHKARHHHPKPRTVTGTVTSFTGGELTIALTGGRTFTATVTNRTIVKCRTAAPQGSTTTPSSTTPATTAAPASTVLPSGKDKRAGHDAGDDHGHHGRHGGPGPVVANGRCGTAALVAGAQVTEAKLSLKNGEATWKKVELLK